MRRSLILVALVAVAVIVPSIGSPRTAQAQTRFERREIDTTFAFDRSGTVSLGKGSATIIVSGWDQNTIRVRARADRSTIRFEGTSNRVTIDPMRTSDDVTIQVSVPRGVHIVARTGSGDITVRGTGGDVEADASSGTIFVLDAKDVTVTNLSGDVEIRQSTGLVTATTNNGDLTVAEAQGGVEVSSVSGEVRISRSTSKIVRAKTTNGSIGFSGAIATDGRYEFVGHSGDIDLILPKDASAQLNLTTFRGSVDSEFPITLKPGFSTATISTTRRYAFTIGGGSARITAETFSGDITITSSRSP